MSNEYKDLVSDRWTEFEANTSILNYLPIGWVKSFIPKMQTEIFNALGSYSDDFEIGQCKEKFGLLRVYWFWKDRDYTLDEETDLKEIEEHIYDILNKYISISSKTCVQCGNLADHFSKGYVLPYCSNCHSNEELK